MGFTKDQWRRPVRQPDGTTKRIRNDRWGKGKRWLAVWHDDTGQERSKAFAKKELADKHWQAMETDRERGEYVDPKAGRELLRTLGKRWLASHVTDPSTMIRYESLWRLHVEPALRPAPGQGHPSLGNPGVASRTWREVRTVHGSRRLSGPPGLPRAGCRRPAHQGQSRQVARRDQAPGRGRRKSPAVDRGTGRSGHRRTP